MSSSNLDLSLDDLIKKSKPSSNHTNKTSSSHHRNPSNNPSAGARTGGGGKDQYHHRSLRRPAPYPNPNASSSSSKYGVYTDHQIAAAAAAAAAAAVSGARSGAIETGTKLYISNLDYGVTNEDIKELFSEVGDIKRYSINYDRSGRSKGTAEVVYAKKDDALAAIRRYNNVQLDGKPMKIEFIGTNLEIPPIPPVPVLPTPSPLLPPFALSWNPPPPFLNGNGMPKSGPGRGMLAGGPRGGGFGGRGRGRGRGSGSGRARGKPISADDLDAELDKYHAQAMEDN